MEETYRRWASNIRFGRRALRMTQEDLGKAVGVSQQTVAAWESARTIPTDKHKVEIANALQQDVQQLFPLTRSVA